MACRATALALPAVLGQHAAARLPAPPRLVALGERRIPGCAITISCRIPQRHCTLRPQRQLGQCRSVGGGAAAGTAAFEDGGPSAAERQLENGGPVLDEAGSDAGIANTGGSSVPAQVGSSSAASAAVAPAVAPTAGASSGEAAKPAAAAAAGPSSSSGPAAAAAAAGAAAPGSSQQTPAWLSQEAAILASLLPAGGGAGAAVAAADSGKTPGVLGALATFFKVLFDTLCLLGRLVLVEPLSWVLSKAGLIANKPAQLVAQLEKANLLAPLSADTLAINLRVINKMHPQATVEFVEKNCLNGPGSLPGGSRFAINAAVVREYLTALVQTGRLSQFGDELYAAPAEGQSHRSLPQLLAELRAASTGQPMPAAPGASVAWPVHVLVQSQEKPGGFWAGLNAFVSTCFTMAALFYVFTAGAAVYRRVYGGAAGQAGMPGGASVAASSSGTNMFAAKEYNKDNMPEKSVKRFKDVKGCDEAINELEEIVQYLKHPEKFTKLGGKLPKGVLLTGPPGTGKTLLARAVAGEAGVPFFYKAGSEFDEMFVGVGSRRVRSLFAAAKKKAPCIIFIDEIDAMGGKRTSWESSGGSRKTLNQLLTDMDGFEENSGVVVVAATNLPELLDTALTRPGRFDRQVAVTLPDVKGRQQIIELYLEGKPVAKDVDAEMLARRTPGFSGAELANLVNESALLAARHDSDKITAHLMDEARDKILMGNPRMITQSMEARKLTAYHEGGHALVALYTAGAKPIHKATIVPRGHALGMVSQVPEKDEYSVTRQQMMAHIDVCMGGKAAEELIFGEDHVTSGATSDLRQATRMARHMVMECGMNEHIGPVAVGDDQSQSMRQTVDAEVQVLLKGAYQRVVSLLKEREAELHTLAQELLRTETLTLADIQGLLAARNSPELPGSGGPSSGSGSEGQLEAGAYAGGEAAAPAPSPAAAAARTAAGAPREAVAGGAAAGPQSA